MLTIASQPAFDGWRDRRRVRQRAFVAGFARTALAQRLACARGVEVRVWAPDLPHDAALGSPGEPVTLEDGLARAFLPGDARAEELALFAEDLAPQALRALSECAFVAAFDPVFGRAGQLFPELLGLGRS
ncbi:MAG: hypothetical protein JNK02_07455 [Planctomycetes bacterium]|nr:hypothetical protein [Planctomycetota bacterium]